VSGPALRWLGQAGYELRSAAGNTMLIDPYLSHYVETEIAQQRAVEPPDAVESAEADILLATHWHPDHLDPDLCKELRDRTECVFVGPSTNTSRLLGWRVPQHRIQPLDRGDTVTLGDFTMTAGFARHEVPGWLVEDAISVAIQVDDIRLFHSGDTEYDARVLPMAAHGPYDVGLFVINGTGGCMNVREAALMAHQFAPARAIPMHYGLWAEGRYGPDATLDPDDFVDYCSRLGGPEVQVLEHGETIYLER
jgi:L-ascorbate metabolism protein UlaG (beta-lactamase superfamily)